MDSSFLIKTLNNNYYFINLIKKQIIYCHPIVLQIFKIWEKNESDFNFDYIIKQKKNIHKNKLKYYFDKTKVLIEKGFFVNTTISKVILDEILPEQIKRWLINSRHVSFEVTEACNLKCKYCGFGEFYSEQDNRTMAKLDSGLAIKFLEYLKSLWNSPLNMSHNKNIVISFYGGEPLLNIEFIKKIVDFATYSDLKHNKVVYNMTTNGVFLDKYIDFLVENNFMITISLDGNEFHNSYRVRKDDTGSFNKVYKNVINIKKNYPEFFKSNVSFNSVLHDKNNVEEIISFFDKKFGKVPSINQLTEVGVKKNKKKLFYEIFKSTHLSLNESSDLDYVKNKMKIRFPGNQDRTFLLNSLLENTFYTYNDLLFDEKIDIIERFPTGTCFPFNRKIFVTAHGKILPCESVSHRFFLGEITNEKVDLDFNYIATKYKNFYSSIKNQCENCYNFSICKECLFKIEGIDENPVCNSFIDYTIFKKYLTDSLTYFENNPTLYEEIMEENILL